MPQHRKLNLTRTLYEAYPHSDLLPIDPSTDCRNLQTLVNRVNNADSGDSLFKFLVIEMLEGGGGSLPGAIRVVEQARADVDAVLDALIEAQRHRRSRKGRTP